MSWGDKEKFFRDIADETGEIPDPLRLKPDMVDHLSTIWRDFFELSSTRNLGFGAVGPIPWIAISAYAERMGINDPDEFERFTTLIRIMDGEYLTFIGEKSKKEQANRSE